MPTITTPYRVCPIGAHVDHQHGVVTGFALDRGVTLTYEPAADGEIAITSRNFAGDVRTSALRRTERQQHWGDYARAAVAALLQAGKHLHTGFTGQIEGTLPTGGLSSSASVIITYLRALCALNGLRLTQEELVSLAHWAETRYIGLNNGVLDQSCEVYSRRDHLLYLDTQTNAYELIPQHQGMAAYEIAIIFSGLDRSLINSSYNARVDECKAAAYALKALEGIEYGKIADTRLRDVPRAVFDRHAAGLPEPWRRRAEHFYGEMDRVRVGLDAWRAGDLPSFGRTMFASGDSSIDRYESGSPELRALHAIARDCDGVYGGRFSGAGFNGCYVALIDPTFEEAVTRRFTDAYLQAFPHLKGRFSVHFCHSADGVTAP